MEPADDASGAFESLEDIAFLANSANRVTVLGSLAEGPHSRDVLAERTGVSRVTLGRILDGLEDRRWISQSGQLAEITPLGAWVAEEFGGLCEMMAAERGLRAVIRWFPEEGFGFHVSRLGDAEITLVTPADASAPIDQLVRQLRGAERVRAFSFAITGQFLDACWRHVVERGHTFEWVFTADVLAVLTTNAEMRRQSREMLDSGRATYYRYDGDIPYIVILTEETVNLRLADAEGAPSALIQSDDDVVLRWAESAFEEYRRRGSPVDPGTFTG